VKQELQPAESALVQALELRSKPVSCILGTTLFRQGDPPIGLFILKSGEANLLMESKVGKPVMCVHAQAGSLLGLPGIIANEPYTMTALVRGGSEVSFVTTGDFESLIQAEPTLYPMVLKVLAAEVRAARRAITGN
jgi:CRP-like cAMP-binding protein